MNAELLSAKIEAINERAGVTVPVAFEAVDAKKKALGRYRPDEDKIILYPEWIAHDVTQGAYRILGIDPDTFAQLVYCHELGHYTDWKRNAAAREEETARRNHPGLGEFEHAFLTCELAIQYEYFAWMNGCAYVPDNLLETYHAYNFLNMHYHFETESRQFMAVCEKHAVDPDMAKRKDKELTRKKFDCLAAVIHSAGPSTIDAIVAFLENNRSEPA